jgi:hypothetical protein
MVLAESGKSFDPKVVEALSKRYQELEQLVRGTLEGPSFEVSTKVNVWRGAAPDAGFASGWEGAGPSWAVCGAKAASEMAVLETIHAGIRRLDPLAQTMAGIQVQLGRLIPLDCLALHMKQDEVLRCVYAAGRNAELLKDLTIVMGVGVSGWVCAHGKPLLNGNALTEFGVSGRVPAGFELQSGMAVALDFEFGPAAVLTLYSGATNAFTADHLRVLLAVESWIAYYLRLKSSGLTVAELQAGVGSKVTSKAELEQLSNSIRSGAVARARQ